jgi:hypothetical protein
MMVPNPGVCATQNLVIVKPLNQIKMTQLEILMLENQIVTMQALYEMSELSHSKMEELRKQIKISRELLAFYKK